MKPDYSDQVVSLYRGSALDVLPDLECDHVICDPPFEVAMHKAKGRGRNVRTDGRQMQKALAFPPIDRSLRVRVCNIAAVGCSGWFIAFCTPEGIAPWRDAIEAAGMRYKRACFYYKPDAAPQFNGHGPAFAVEPFVTAWCGKGVSKWNGGGRRNLWTANTNNADREGTEPTEKPVELMIDLIRNFTNEGDIICDPFMGSGTTIIAAVACGRRAVGIEKDTATFKLALARYQSAFMGRDEGQRHITRSLQRLVPPGPLFN